MAVGGTRFLPYESDTEAIQDVLRLSKAMTYKCALAGLPYGGGKAVIMGPPGMSNKDFLLAYAGVIEDLGGLFKTGTDVGISDKDVVTMKRGTRHMIGAETLGDPTLPTTAEMAALGVFYAIEASLGHHFGDTSVHGRRIGIKGVGKLGGHLAKLLHASGAKLVIGDVDKVKVAEIVNMFPDITALPPAEVHAQALDVYAPCALGHEFTLTTIKTLRAPIVAGGANNQLASLEVGEVMHREGILYAPDYIANAGGLIHVTGELEPGGYDRVVVQDRVKAIAQTLTDIYLKSRHQNRSTSVVADEIGQKIMKDAQ